MWRSRTRKCLWCARWTGKWSPSSRNGLTLRAEADPVHYRSRKRSQGGAARVRQAMSARNPHLDCSLALMVIVTFFVDNQGSCTMQVAKLAKFLSRSERAILAAYKRLEADGVIIVRSDSPGTVTSVVRNIVDSQAVH